MRQPKWTPPIFGWQYWLYWDRNGTEVTATSWDWYHWQGHKYFVWVQGSAHGTRLQWSVFFNVTHQSIRVRFMEQNSDLSRAIRGVERQVRALEEAMLELRKHEGKK